MSMICKVCSKRCTKGEYCMFHRPKKPIPRRGQRTLDYEEWRDTIAKPYLNKKGRHCAVCRSKYSLHVDHIKNRGSSPELKMDLTNVQYLCSFCHAKKTDGKDEDAFKPKMCERGCGEYLTTSKQLPYHEFCDGNYKR